MLQFDSLLGQQTLPRFKDILQRKPATFPLKKGGQILRIIGAIGLDHSMDEYEKNKLAIFNQLCFFQLLTGISFPLFGLFHNLSAGAGPWLLSVLPALVALLVLFFNAVHKYESAFYAYFLLYPLSICVVYLNRIDLGIELSFVLCGILSVFFLREKGQMIFAIGFSMVSYFALFLMRREAAFPPVPIDSLVYIFNQVVTIIYIFYALYLIMRENHSFQLRLLQKNRNLHAKNLEIQRQQDEIEIKAILLEKQARELKELDRLKNKLFSIVAHDLKAPMFALRNVFNQLRTGHHSEAELKELMPEIITDLNYTTSLVENLLEWARSQMHTSGAMPEEIDLNKLVEETVRLYMPQLRNKNIRLERKMDIASVAYADPNMIRLVFRNLLSNAIKFTPQNGRITVGINDLSSCVEIYVKDSGIGISRDAMHKINQNIFYTTYGTHNESGTGLGLMLCKEFLYKNDSRLMIESNPGEGSTFSFALKATG